MTHADPERMSYPDSPRTAPADAKSTVTWDGHSAAALARRCGVPRLELLVETESTQDVAHALANDGAEAGTTVLAEAQRAGRGRLGRTWTSGAGLGVWCSVIERPKCPFAMDVLSLRVGLHCAEALDEFAGQQVRVKWPNDLVISSGAEDPKPRKLGGVLVEVRWSGTTVSWVAIGVGINVVAPPAVNDASGLVPHTRRADVLAAVVGAVRSAAAVTYHLSESELARYRARDVLAGRRIASPADGIANGITSDGSLIVNTARGAEQFRAGTILLLT